MKLRHVKITIKHTKKVIKCLKIIIAVIFLFSAFFNILILIFNTLVLDQTERYGGGMAGLGSTTAYQSKGQWLESHHFHKLYLLFVAGFKL